ncbi:unnamed protein product [Alopecurus aequalis]
MLTDDSVGSTTELGDEDRSVSGDSLSEWRSCDQVDNGSPSTSPPFWDTDGEYDDPGPSPRNLFGRFTWRIENFSKEKKREMKSEPFEAGGFKWYILVYPQGCDVSNHLSLFLCVANHDKHLPGWSQFAQFTIAVGNLDPKKVKYSDTLHKFWKKEHDWGWKKFMELSKIQDGFLVDDVLEIIAQVQVIREKVDRPFCCLDRPYRRELLRVYMANIEQIYRRFVEEHRSKLTKLTEDKLSWSSFRAFWLAIDPSTRRRMSREKCAVILKIIVKHFFVEKEVTSTLVMDSLHTGLKALEHQCRRNSIDSEKLSAPMVHVDYNMFVLPGDVLALLERAALEPLPCQPLSPKEDKCPQSRTKDGSSGEVKVSIEHEEKRLTVFGQKILETFVLSHIFSGIEVAYQEAVALKRQEELIREEEEAGPLGNEMKGKRGSITEKEKRAKKKQAKQKKNNRKVKDKDREEKFDSTFPEKGKDEITIHDMEDSKQAGQVAMKVDTSEEGASDISDNLDGSAEACQAGAKKLHPVDGMNDVGIETENVPTGKNCTVENKSLSCSSGSATMDIMQGKSDNLLDNASQISSCPRGKTQRRVISSMGIAKDKDDLPSSTSSGSDRNTSDCGPAPKLDQETVLLTLKDRLQKLGQRLHEKEIEGRKLLKAHLEKKAAAEAALSSSSSSSLEKTPNVLKNPEQPLVTSPDACVCAPCSKSKPVATDSVYGAIPALPNTRISTESGPSVAPIPSKAEPALFKEHVSSLNLKIGRAAPVASRSLPADKAATLTSSSSLVKKSIPATSKSPAARVAPIPAPPKPSAPQAGRVAKATPAPPKSPAPQIEKVAKAIPVLPKSSAPQVDKVVPLNTVPRQLPPVSNLEARKITVQKKIVVTCVPRTPAASRPSSAPLFQAPRSTLPPTTAVQVPTLQSRSFTVSRGATNQPSPPVTSYVPQTYRNAIIGNGSLDTNLSSLDKATSLGQSNALPHPLSAYASTTSVMLPPVGRNGQLPGNQGFMSGHGKLGTLDNWHPWKGDSDGNKHMWRDDTPYQQTNVDARICPWNDNSYQQANNSGTEEQGGFGGIQHRQFQREMPANFVSHQLQGSVGEEFPHLDIINDLLEEEQSNVSMAEPPLHEYQAFGLPFSPRGNLAEADIASLSSSGRSNLTEHYYDEGYPGAHDRLNALHRLREGQFSTFDAYSNGRVDSISPKPWLYNYPNPMVNPGVNSNGFSQQMGDYTNYASGRMNEEYLYRSANGQW